MNGGRERRLDPRGNIQVALEVLPSPVTGEEPIRLTTRNLSTSGALCVSPVSLPLKNILPCRLLLPGSGPDGVPADVIVLRVESSIAAAASSHQVALYFVEMRSSDREKIRRFVFEAIASARKPEPSVTQGKG
jgi:c-di-GMP-binding flagellar brake protein YcgR